MTYQCGLLTSRNYKIYTVGTVHIMVEKTSQRSPAFSDIFVFV